MSHGLAISFSSLKVNFKGTHDPRLRTITLMCALISVSVSTYVLILISNMSAIYGKKFVMGHCNNEHLILLPSEEST